VNVSQQAPTGAQRLGEQDVPLPRNNPLFAVHPINVESEHAPVSSMQHAP
jgi:hypothetical protein